MNDRPPVFYTSHFYKGVESTALNTSGNDVVHKGLRRGLIRGLHVYGDGVKVFEETVKQEIVSAMDIVDGYQGGEFEFMTFISRSLANIMSILLSGSPFQTSNDADLFTRYTESFARVMEPATDFVLMTFPFVRFLPGYYRQICKEHWRIQNEILKKYFDSVKKTYTPGTIRGLVDFFLSEQARDVEGECDVLYTDGRIITNILDVLSAAVFKLKGPKFSMGMEYADHISMDRPSSPCSPLLTTKTNWNRQLGTVTSRATLGATILCLLEYSDYQTKLQNEIDDVIGRDRLPNLDDRSSCPLTEAFAMEVQRFHTVTPLALVHMSTKYTEFDGYSIPAGSLSWDMTVHIPFFLDVCGSVRWFWGVKFYWPKASVCQLLSLNKHLLLIHFWAYFNQTSQIFPNLWYIHHNKEIWDDPWTFRPERFLNEHGQLLERDHSYRKNWIPFGIGKRQCPAEMFARSRLFLYIASFLQSWTFYHAGSKPSCDPRKGSYNVGITNEPKPFYCKVKNRQ